MTDMPQTPLRRIRVRYLDYHNPRVWASYFDPPGRSTCYCHASTLDEMWQTLKDYFEGNGYCLPQRISEPHRRASQ